jgi:hypothetical protein
MSTKAPVVHQDAWRSPEREQTYLDALTLEKTAWGTVCVVLDHYRKGRHPVPYRMGYCHNQGQSTEHWHSNEKEHLACPDRQMKKYADD